ncbi:hypothetical protein AVDCRST_MAG84-7309, partial [uncultured Microcoleus sp.]
GCTIRKKPGFSPDFSLPHQDFRRNWVSYGKSYCCDRKFL